MSSDPFLWLRSIDLYPKFYWKSNDLELAGAGTASPPFPSRAFGWLHFSPTEAEEWRDFAPAFFFHPRFHYHIPHGEQNNFTFSPYKIEQRSSLPEKPEWMRMIQNALTAIEAKEFEKVVCAKRVALSCSSALDPLAICQSLSSGKNGIIFLFQPSPGSAFLGVSPERLFRRKGREIECDALAGTRKIHEAAELLSSEKELREFLIVKEHLLNVLSPLCQFPPTASPHAIRTTPTVCHIHSSIRGQLKEGVDDDMLLNALHPNPAIGGHPRQEALSFLRSCEPFGRGLYAAPIGWKGPDSAEFAVGIRSCLIQGNRAYLYAGTGIVAGSDPSAEWEESEQKLTQWNAFFE